MGCILGRHCDRNRFHHPTQFLRRKDIRQFRRQRAERARVIYHRRREEGDYGLVALEYDHVVAYGFRLVSNVCVNYTVNQHRFVYHLHLPTSFASKSHPHLGLISGKTGSKNDRIRRIAILYFYDMGTWFV